MFTKYGRRQLSRDELGDGSPLQPYRPWQLFTRSLFSVELTEESGDRHHYEVDVRHGRDSWSSRRPAALHRDGVRIRQADLPAAFPVPGGIIEVAVDQYGVERMHHVTDDGRERVLRPHPRSLEGRRARFGRRFPRTSAAVGAVGLVVLLVGLAVALSIAAEQLTRVEVIAARIGPFTSPVRLPGWAEIALVVAGALAATDRGMRFASTRLADSSSGAAGAAHVVLSDAGPGGSGRS